MGLAILIVGLVVMLGAHVFVTRRKSRAELVARLGEMTYKGLFSLVSLIGLALVVWGFSDYRATGWIEVWHPPSWTRHVTVGLMWLASICVIAAYLQGDIKRTLKHPMLVGVKLWAFGHLIANGDLVGIVLFGSILAWAVYDRISLKYRTDPGGPSVPIGGRRNDILAIVAGTILYLVLAFLFHPLVIGIPVMGTPAYGT